MRSNLKKARIRRPHHANFAPKSRERNAKFSEFRRAARTKFACTRPACVLKIAECRCSSSPSRRFVHIGKCARPAFEITQILRQTRAKELQIFQNFSATSTQKCVHSASVRCANSRTLLRPFNEAAVRSDPKRHAPDVEITQIFCPSFTKKMQIISGISARRAHKKNACIRPACVARTVEPRCSCLPSRMCVRIWKKRAFSVHITQILR